MVQLVSVVATKVSSGAAGTYLVNHNQVELIRENPDGTSRIHMRLGSNRFFWMDIDISSTTDLKDHMGVYVPA